MTQYLAVHFSSQRTDWQTPTALKKELEKEFGALEDVCPPNHERDMLKEPWPERVFCNPPYGREIVNWVGKAFKEVVELRLCDIAVLLLPARTETKWFHDYLTGAELRFIKGRLHFDDRGPAPFPSLIAILSRDGLCMWCRLRAATEWIFEPGGPPVWICGHCRVEFGERNVGSDEDTLDDVCRTCCGNGYLDDVTRCPECDGSGSLDY